MAIQVLAKDRAVDFDRYSSSALEKVGDRHYLFETTGQFGCCDRTAAWHLAESEIISLKQNK
jgi:hypothetical protein